MATKTLVSLIDDVDGEAADETVRFGLGNVSYEIDLSHANAERLRAGLAPFVAAGRRQGRTAAVESSPSTHRRRTVGNQEIRDWAIRTGLAVARAGRVPQSIRDAYAAAMAGPEPAAFTSTGA